MLTVKAQNATVIQTFPTCHNYWETEVRWLQTHIGQKQLLVSWLH